MYLLHSYNVSDLTAVELEKLFTLILGVAFQVLYQGPQDTVLLCNCIVRLSFKTDEPGETVQNC